MDGEVVGGIGEEGTADRMVEMCEVKREMNRVLRMSYLLEYKTIEVHVPRDRKENVNKALYVVLAINTELGHEALEEFCKPFTQNL